MINLDPKALYKLTKVKTNNPDSRYFKDGDTYVGQAQMFGDCLMIGDVLTSTVKSVEDLGNGNYAIQTRNFGYTLEKLDQ